MTYLEVLFHPFPNRPGALHVGAHPHTPNRKEATDGLATP